MALWGLDSRDVDNIARPLSGQFEDGFICLRIGHQALIKIVPQLTSDCKASHVSVPVGSGVVWITETAAIRWCGSRGVYSAWGRYFCLRPRLCFESPLPCHALVSYILPWSWNKHLDYNTAASRSKVICECIFRLLAGVPMTVCCYLPRRMSHSSTWSYLMKAICLWQQMPLQSVGLSRQHRSLILRHSIDSLKICQVYGKCSRLVQ